MPIVPTFPGVYIEEIPSGVHTITGVATSITAFIGRAASGPTNDPTVINSFADYQRLFGGLSLASTMSFAVRDFFVNGGGQAVIVRLYRPGNLAASETASAAAGNTPEEVVAAIKAKAGTFTQDPDKSAAAAVLAAAQKKAGEAGATADDIKKAAAAAAAQMGKPKAVVSLPAKSEALNLEASSEGSWANGLQVRVEAEPDPKDNTRFRLLVRDSATGATEVFPNLSVKNGDPRRVDIVLGQESQLVRVSGKLPANPPDASPAPIPPHGIFDEPFTGDPVPFSRVAAPGADDGLALADEDFTKPDNFESKTGLYALRKTDLFNLLCIPPYMPDGSIGEGIIDVATKFCEDRRAMFLIDPPPVWATLNGGQRKVLKEAGEGSILEIGSPSKNAAVFFPRLRQPNPFHENQTEEFVPCGAVAGVFARTDAERGVWKAPAGIEATLKAVSGLAVPLSDAENGQLNPLGVNCLRNFPGAGIVAWGARTREGDDRTGSEWKYIPVRRTALFIEESLFRGTKWVVFEPNDEPLWAQIRLNVGAFMQGLFRQGAFQGKTPQEAYFVKCDKETTTQQDIDRGVVNIVVGFAPLKPAEFVVIKLQQIAGQLQA
jgi:phage tail sheath protein FI